MTEAHSSALRGRCEDEIVELHRFFQAWLRGEIDPDGDGFSRLGDALAVDFHRVSADGAIAGRSEVLAEVREGHGSKPPDFAIRAEGFRFRAGSRRLAVVTYEEWHEPGGPHAAPGAGRISTAVFQDRADAPNGVEWVHLHETFLR